jgi:tetratricopeptide (TPR) repeat protein
LRGGTVRWSRTSGYAESLYAALHHGCAPLAALREKGWKLERGSSLELFDLGKDPRELKNFEREEPARARAMAEALDELVGELHAGAAESATLDAASRKALESLGYSWSPPDTASRARTRDPREALRSMKKMADADRSALRGDVNAAAALYRDVLAAEPASIDARVRLAQIFLTAGRSAEAERLLSAAVAIAPKEPELHRRHGDALVALGRPKQALAAYDAGLALHPPGHELRDARWRVLVDLDRSATLRTEAERAIAADPKDGVARHARALACCGKGRVEDYIAALERELKELPGDRVLTEALGKARAEKRSAPR